MSATGALTLSKPSRWAAERWPDLLADPSPWINPARQSPRDPRHQPVRHQQDLDRDGEQQAQRVRHGQREQRRDGCGTTMPGGGVNQNSRPIRRCQTVRIWPAFGPVSGHLRVGFSSPQARREHQLDAEAASSLERKSIHESRSAKSDLVPAISADIARYQLAVGDLVIAMDGSLVGRSFARLCAEDLPAVLLQRVARLRSKAIDIDFLMQLVGSDQFVQYCDSVKTVTAIPHISATDIRNFECNCPTSSAEQTAIATLLSDIDADITALETRRDKTRALKLGMMQVLLTGTIRLL
jgi:Type I restriction modification DNA specificity domain